MTAMPAYVKTASLVGLIGIPIGMILMFMTMGLPVGNILLCIPSGIVTAKLLLRQQNPDRPGANKVIWRAGLISGAISSLGLIIPLAVLAFLAPSTARISQEFSQFLDLSYIPPMLDDFRVAIFLVGVIGALSIIGLTATAAFLTFRSHKNR